MFYRFISVPRNRLFLLLSGAAIIWLATVMAPADHRALHRETLAASSVLPEAPSQTNSSAALPMRETLDRARSNPFAPRSWEPRRPKPVAQPVAQTPPPTPPAAPPLPYRLAGSVQHNGRVTIVLAAGDRIHFVRPGETIDDMYLVRAVSRDAVTLVYTPLGIEQVATYAAETSPVQGPTSSPAQVVAEALPPAPTPTPAQPPQAVTAIQPPPAVTPAQPVLTPAAAASRFPPGSPLAAR